MALIILEFLYNYRSVRVRSVECVQMTGDFFASFKSVVKVFTFTKPCTFQLLSTIDNGAKNRTINNDVMLTGHLNIRWRYI